MQLTAKEKPSEISDPFELFWMIKLVGSIGQSCGWADQIGLPVPRHSDVNVNVGSPHQSCMTMIQRSPRSPAVRSNRPIRPNAILECHTNP